MNRRNDYLEDHLRNWRTPRTVYSTHHPATGTQNHTISAKTLVYYVDVSTILVIKDEYKNSRLIKNRPESSFDRLHSRDRSASEGQENVLAKC